RGHKQKALQYMAALRKVNPETQKLRAYEYLLETEPVVPPKPIPQPVAGSVFRDSLQNGGLGRNITSDDMLNMGIDALVFVPASFFAGPFGVQPLAQEIVVSIGFEAISFTPYPYHLVKPLGTFVILTGNETSKMLTEKKEMAKRLGLQQENMIPTATEQVIAFMKQSKEIFNQQLGPERISYDVTKPLLFLHQKTGNKMNVIEFEASVFMRNDAKVVMNPARGLSEAFFR
ncbi:hypothetical protein THIOM_002958, partial [Candidatus Thiomargarita nelsonii]